MRYLIFAFLSFSLPLRADTWIDEDGVSAVQIKDGYLSIYSLDDFYYFDELFTDVRQGASLQLCVGFGGGGGMASDCLGNFVAAPAFYNQGKNRALHFDISGFSFVFSSFESHLLNGRTMKLSIDNDDLFSAYNLNIENVLTEESLNILALD